MKRIIKVLSLIAILSAPAFCNPIIPWAVSEFSTQPPWIEIHFVMPADLSGLVLHTIEGNATINSGIYGDPESNPYVVLDQTNTSGFTLNPNGDSIVIEQLYIIVAYGTKGPRAVAPLQNESASTDEHHMGYVFYGFEPTPNPGGVDTAAYVRWGESSVLINEINVGGSWNRCPDFIELYNTSNAPCDISGYQFICGSRYIISQGSVVRPHGYYVLDECRYPEGFYPEISADVIYFLDDDGCVVDQVGWSSDHGSDVSFMRYPDGNVNHDHWEDFAGYDDSSSYTFSDGFPTRRAYNRVENPGLKIIGIDADTSGLVNLYWTNPIWLTTYDATIVRRSTTGFPQTQYDGDLVYEGTDQQLIGDTAIAGQVTYYSVFARTGCGQYSIPDSESQISVFMPSSGIDDSSAWPDKTGYLASYPNPFNATTLLTYRLARSGPVEISIFNLIGQKVAVLSRGQQIAGEHSIVWNAGSCPSGVYFARLEAGGHSDTKKLVLLK